ncbi:hypothetical protein NUKP67_52100 [Klebsiella variicola]|nr:hypothetical protein NUKP67_52100 [Klebsiella variicola]
MKKQDLRENRLNIIFNSCWLIINTVTNQKTPSHPVRVTPPNKALAIKWIILSSVSVPSKYSLANIRNVNTDK